MKLPTPLGGSAESPMWLLQRLFSMAFPSALAFTYEGLHLSAGLPLSRPSPHPGRSALPLADLGPYLCHREGKANDSCRVPHIHKSPISQLCPRCLFLSPSPQYIPQSAKFCCDKLYILKVAANAICLQINHMYPGEEQRVCSWNATVEKLQFVCSIKFS